jgi:integrase
VFHRPDGAQIKDFRASWRTACEAAAYPGKLFHDFRRSAVRTLERSGVPRSTAMAMIGHKTESIYRRYAIVDEAMLQEAAAKLDVWAVDQRAKAKAERKGQLERFKKRQAS